MAPEAAAYARALVLAVNNTIIGEEWGIKLDWAVKSGWDVCFKGIRRPSMAQVHKYL